MNYVERSRDSAGDQSLTKSDYAQLMRWLNEYDWDEWDRQIGVDSEAGKLDFLVSQAKEAKREVGL